MEDPFLAWLVGLNLPQHYTGKYSVDRPDLSFSRKAPQKRDKYVTAVFRGQAYNRIVPPENPCEYCGACCAYFRVSFYWLEAHFGVENPVPLDLTEDLPPHRLCMCGTNQPAPRCVALTGEIGSAVACAIYANRPSVCRDFGIQYQDGMITISREDLVRCNQARAVFQLSALVLPDSRQANAGQVEVGV